jgi:L-cysteine S-thiosulfotransferase
MIRKSGYRFSEKIMLGQNAGADHRFNLKHHRFCARCCVAGMALALAAAVPARAEPVHYVIVGDAIPASLTGASGNAAHGRAIVADRNVGLCLLCHTGPFPENKFQGNIAPDLAGAGSRWNEGQLRLRIVDASKLNPNTIMPPFYRVGGLTRVPAVYRDKPVLTAVEVEDVIAYLMTLK